MSLVLLLTTLATVQPGSVVTLTRDVEIKQDMCIASLLTASPTNIPTTLPTKIPTKTKPSGTKHYQTGNAETNAANSKQDLKAGNGTVIALASVCLVFILLLLVALIFLVRKVSQLSDSTKGNSGSAGRLATKHQSKKTII